MALKRCLIGGVLSLKTKFLFDFLSWSSLLLLLLLLLSSEFNTEISVPPSPSLTSSRAGLQLRTTTMALTNFILTVAGVGAVVLLLRSDVKKSAVVFRRNVRHIRQWLEEESSVANKKTDGEKMKELPKGDKD